MSTVRSGIYKIVNKVNGKYYVGSSKDLRGTSYGRWKTHICKLNRGCHPNQHLQNAWNKYGRNNFEFLIVEETTDLISREQQYLNLASTDRSKCYNLSYQAYKVDMTPERRKKISNSLKGRFVGNLHPFFGKTHTEETRRKLSTSHLGQVSHNKGKSMSVEQKEKIRATLLQKRHEISGARAMDWKFYSPTNEHIVVHNLLSFCKQNNLQVSHMWAVFNGKRPHHKGWRKA